MPTLRLIRYGRLLWGILALSLFQQFCFANDTAPRNAAAVQNDGTALTGAFAQQVDCRLDLPQDEQNAYADLLIKNLEDLVDDHPQYVILVDRNPFVQAAMIYWMSAERVFHFIGASPVSTGKPGKFEHFITPTGVFEHTVAHPDYRSMGTPNEHGIRGYGRKGMRVYDFGWRTAEKAWDGGGLGKLRLQMHATDPDLLEPKLGTPQSEGCIRIPATLNTFIDHYGLLDGDYEAFMAKGRHFSVLSETREATPWSGKYLVVVDTERTERPAWSPTGKCGQGRCRRAERSREHMHPTPRYDAAAHSFCSRYSASRRSNSLSPPLLSCAPPAASPSYIRTTETTLRFVLH